MLCEGVMGLFDGTGADGETGSTAELARLTGWPVVLVVDARGQGASVAALLRGFAGHRRDVAGRRGHLQPGRRRAPSRAARRRGRAASARPRHARRAARRPGAGPALAPSRPGAGGRGRRGRGGHRARRRPDRRVRRHRSAAAAGPAVAARAAPLRHAGIPPLGQHIAVARDDAFCFAYPALLDGWRRAGAELSFFSPLADEPPAPAADAVYLPGGYPELWAGRLAAAASFLGGLRRAAADGKPVYGECGGYMVLGEGLIDADGGRHAMAGLLPLETSFAERRLHLGYRCARLLATDRSARAARSFAATNSTTRR